MRRHKALDVGTNSQVDRRLRRLQLGCSFCPSHDGENRGRRPKDDRHKNHRRYK